VIRAAIAVVLATGLACSSKSPEFDGLGPWRFGHTTLKDTGGLCQPTDVNGRQYTWCFAQQPLKVAGSTAEVDLYFLGTEPTARLVEIQLKVRGCHEDALDQWLRSAFGPPIQDKPTRGYWKNSFLWIAAMLPSEPGRCLVRALPLSENAEIERIKQL
jgi:hypothetical protein